MKIQMKQTFGRRRVMRGAKILPGVYASDDPALFGLADELVSEGYAVVVDDDTPVHVIAPELPVSKPVGLTHEEFERLTGRIAPPRPVETITGDEPTIDSEAVMFVEEDESLANTSDKPKKSRK